MRQQPHPKDIFGQIRTAALALTVACLSGYVGLLVYDPRFLNWIVTFMAAIAIAVAISVGNLKLEISARTELDRILSTWRAVHKDTTLSETEGDKKR